MTSSELRSFDLEYIPDIEVRVIRELDECAKWMHEPQQLILGIAAFFSLKESLRSQWAFGSKNIPYGAGLIYRGIPVFLAGLNEPASIQVICSVSSEIGRWSRKNG